MSGLRLGRPIGAFAAEGLLALRRVRTQWLAPHSASTNAPANALNTMRLTG